MCGRWDSGGRQYTAARVFRAGRDHVRSPWPPHASFGWAINSLGQVVGWSDLENGDDHAFLWQNGAMTDLGALGGTFSQAFGISPAGKIVGMSFRPFNAGYHPTLWTVK